MSCTALVMKKARGRDVRKDSRGADKGLKAWQGVTTTSQTNSMSAFASNGPPLASDCTTWTFPSTAARCRRGTPCVNVRCCQRALSLRPLPLLPRTVPALRTSTS
eukprot:3533170-Rhodomonas_salina.1